MLKENINLQKDNILIHGNEGTGKTLFIESIYTKVFPSNRKVILFTESSLKSHFISVVASNKFREVSTDLSILKSSLKNMYCGDLNNTTILIDLSDTVMVEGGLINLLKRFLNSEDKNNNNIILTCNNKSLYSALDFDYYLICYKNKQGTMIIEEDCQNFSSNNINFCATMNTFSSDFGGDLLKVITLNDN